MKVVFTGGGSGGHIFPILAIIREIKKMKTGALVNFYYIGTGDDYSLNLLRGEGVKVKKISAGKIRRYFSLKNIVDVLFKIPFGVVQAFFLLFFIAPDVIFSKGGFASFPSAIGGKILGIPMFLHESDAVPGLASKFVAKWSTEIFTSFMYKDLFPSRKIICIGNPIRENILNGDPLIAEEMFKLVKDKPLITIIGGSQGSQRINETVLNVLDDLLERFEIIHQTGDKHYKYIDLTFKGIIQKEGLKKRYHIYPFLNEEQMKHALAASDIIISRAGAGAIYEIAAVGKPSILIPLESSAQDHQRRNAYVYSDYGACEVLEEKNLTPHFLLEKLKYFIERDYILKRMSQRAKEFSKPRSAEIMASYIIEYMKAMK